MNQEELVTMLVRDLEPKSGKEMAKLQIARIG
jgi:hypothetical protein